MSSQAQKQQRKAASRLGSQARAQIQAAKAADDAMETAQANLLEATAQIESLEAAISLKTQENSELKITQGKLLDKVSTLESQTASVSSKNSVISHNLRIARQKCNRHSKRIGRLMTTITQLKKADTTQCRQLKAFKSQSRDLRSQLHWLEAQNQKLLDTVSKVQSSGEVAQQKYKEGLALARSKLVDTQQQNSMLKKKTHRAAGVLKRSVARTEKATLLKATTYHLMEKGVFKEPVHDLVRYLFRTGVPAYRMDELIHKVCELVGIQISGTISRTSVARFIKEGEVSAKLQIGYELSQTQGMFSEYS